MNKPMHLKARGPRSDRQGMWEVIRNLHKQGHLTTRAIRGELSGNVPKSRVYDYVKSLVKAGILQRCEDNPTRLRLVADHGVDAPRVRPDGTVIKPGSSRENMWRSMRILGHFTARELAFAASTEAHPCAESTAQDYCAYLSRAGYLIGSKRGYRFVFSRYSGPKPPMIQRTKRVYDPNLGAVVWPEVNHG